jgi:hypothetical protein
MLYQSDERRCAQVLEEGEPKLWAILIDELRQSKRSDGSQSKPSPPCQLKALSAFGGKADIA